MSIALFKINIKEGNTISFWQTTSGTRSANFLCAKCVPNFEIKELLRITGSLSIGTDNKIYSSSSHFAWAVFCFAIRTNC